MHRSRCHMTRLELEALWRSGVKEAQEQYYRAAENCKKILQERQERLTPSPDGDLALRQALRQESTMLRQYMRLLKTFTRLVANGEIPPED